MAIRSTAAVAEAEPLAWHSAHSGHPRTLALRPPAGDPAWELWLRRPPPPLAHLVAGLWGGDGTATHVRHRSLPNGEAWLMFNLGPPQRLVEIGGVECDVVSPGAFVCGLQDRPLTFESVARHPRVVSIRLLPLGAWAFFGGLPLDELGNRVVDLAAVLGGRAGVELLREQLANAPDLGAALEVLEHWLERRLTAGPSPHPVVRSGYERLCEYPEDARVDALARELGVSSRRLHGLFRSEIGVSPKTLARVLRFERVLGRVGAAHGRDLARVAHDSGYYDQAHMNRDFRELAGLTPTEYFARLFEAPGWREVRG